MDMVLVGADGAALPEFKIAGDYRIGRSDMVLPSLEIAGPGGHWVEVSRAICPGEPNDETKQMMDAMNVEFEFQVRRSLRSWLLSAGAPATPTGRTRPVPACASSRRTISRR